MKKLILGLAVGSLLLGQEKVDEATTAKMRSEELEHSQIMRTLHTLTDRYGPRVTGSPNHEAAAKWAVSQMTAWGLKNAHLEPWDFGHPGWLNESATGKIVAPVKQNLKFEVIAWTPSTKGAVAGSTMQVVPPQGPLPPAAEAGGRGGGGLGGPPVRLGPLQEDFDKWLAETQPTVKGKMVMIGKWTVVPANYTNPSRVVPVNYKAPPPEDPAGPGRGAGRGAAPPADPTRYTAAQVAEKIDAMLVAGGAMMRINDAARGEGIIVAEQHRGYDEATAVPTVVVRNDDFGRIERLMADGDDVKLQFDIVNHSYPEGKTSYNVIAEIPGTDKADEVVMLGGHLDSWHGGTGAMDNAIGCSVIMEAARLIQWAGVKPRRTIRAALWSGEEQGLYGSRAYVKQHFGTAEDPKPEGAKFNGYFNVDGSGRLRLGGIFGPPEAAAILRPVFALFGDWGVGLIDAHASRALGYFDSTSFNSAGLPGIDMDRGNPVTGHTNLDTYERIIPEDAQRNAAIIAAGVLHLANRDEMVPRFEKDKMPAPVKVPTF